MWKALMDLLSKTGASIVCVPVVVKTKSVQHRSFFAIDSKQVEYVDAGGSSTFAMSLDKVIGHSLIVPFSRSVQNHSEDQHCAFWPLFYFQQRYGSAQCSRAMFVKRVYAMTDRQRLDTIEQFYRDQCQLF
jgi:hypothetical protein